MSYNPGDILKERYIIKEILGEGSMGEVYRAEHVTIHRMFAIKLMHVHIAEKSESLARFQREANAAAQLDHPHICQVTDFDSTENGDFYLVMEYLKGETLRDRLEREGTIDLKSVFRIMYDLLGALECAHEAGIVHRDIKPENISLINREDRDDYVKLIDFGIAHADKPVDGHGVLTQSGQVYGTPQYLSPEQVMGEHVDLRADLYSCGCLLFEMLEGTPPFNGNNYILLLNKHLVVDPPHLSKEFKLSQEVDAVIQKLLMKHPEDRFSSAREVRAVLSDIANRFDPNLNLRMTQSGGSNPSITEIHQDCSDATSKVNLNQSSSTSNSSIDPKEITPTQKKSDSNEAPKKTRIGKVAIACGIVFFLLAAVILYTLVIQKQTNDLTSSADPSLLMGVPDMDPNHITDGDIKLSDDIIQQYASTECTILKTNPLFKDENIKAAADYCLQNNYEEAFKALDKIKINYHQDIHFNIMMMLNAYAINKYDVVVRNFLKIIDTDPAAVCNPVVRDIGYTLFENDAAYQDLRVGLNLLNPAHSSESLAWMLLLTPCNHHQKRFTRLASCFDRVDSDDEATDTPVGTNWLEEAVNLWRPFRIKGACRIRQKRLDPIVLKGLQNACTHADGSLVTNNAKCSECYDIWLERESTLRPARVAPNLPVQSAVAPSANPAHPMQVPSAEDAIPTPAPSAIPAQPMQVPSAEDAIPTLAPSANPAQLEQVPSAENAIPTPAPSANPAQPMQVPTAGDAIADQAPHAP